MLKVLLVEDNVRLQKALKTGLEATNKVDVVAECETGEDAFRLCLEGALADVLLMDVALAHAVRAVFRQPGTGVFSECFEAHGPPKSAT